MKAKLLTKEQILLAMRNTKSNRSAARYLNCSYIHYKRFAKLYKDEATDKTLFELHLNRSGKGISKFSGRSQKMPALLDIVEGRVNADNYTPEKIKERLVKEGYLEEKCENCGFQERRVIDYKMPLILSFKDNNKKNYRQDNVHLLCYNCYYLLVGNIFAKKDLEQLEDHRPLFNTTDAINFELDEYHIEKLKELGLYDPPTEDTDGSDLISKL